MFTHPGRGRQSLTPAAQRPSTSPRRSEIRKVEALMVALSYGQRPPFVPRLAE